MSEYITLHLTRKQLEHILDLSEKIGSAKDVWLDCGKDVQDSEGLIRQRNDAIEHIIKESASKWWPSEPK